MSVVIVNAPEQVAKEILKVLAKQGYRATENHEVQPDGTKIIVFTK
jgi:hypothetical protein